MPRRTGGIKNGKAKFAWTESKTKSNRPLLRTLLEQEPRLGGKIGSPRPQLRELSEPARVVPGDPTLFPLPAAEAKSARALRPLWRDLIMKVWGEDPLLCPCCKGTMPVVGTIMRREEVDCRANACFAACHEPGSHCYPRRQTRKECAEGALNFTCDSTDCGTRLSDCLRRPTRLLTSKNAEGSKAFWTEAQQKPAGRARRAGRAGRAGRANQTMEPLDVPPQWGWSDEIGPPPADWWCGEEAVWEAPELDFGDGRVLVLDAGDPFPVDDLPVFAHH